MTDQFEAEKCLHVASVDNLVLMIIDCRAGHSNPPGDPWTIQIVQIQDESRCKTPEQSKEQHHEGLSETKFGTKY